MTDMASWHSIVTCSKRLQSSSVNVSLAFLRRFGIPPFRAKPNVPLILLANDVFVRNQKAQARSAGLNKAGLFPVNDDSKKSTFSVYKPSDQQ